MYSVLKSITKDTLVFSFVFFMLMIIYTVIENYVKEQEVGTK